MPPLEEGGRKDKWTCASAEGDREDRPAASYRRRRGVGGGSPCTSAGKRPPKKKKKWGRSLQWSGFHSISPGCGRPVKANGSFPLLFAKKQQKNQTDVGRLIMKSHQPLPATATARPPADSDRSGRCVTGQLEVIQTGCERRRVPVRGKKIGRRERRHRLATNVASVARGDADRAVYTFLTI